MVFIILKFSSQKANKMDESSTPESNGQASAYSFSVEFNDQPKKARRKPPKHLLERHSKRKEVSHESIEEKQRKAEDRRKVSIWAELSIGMSECCCI